MVDNLIKRTSKTSQEKSILRFLTESPSISSQIIICSDKSIDSKERFESCRTLHVNYLHDTNNTRNHPNSNIIRDQINNIYRKNHSSRGSEKSESPVVFIPGISTEDANTSDTHNAVGSSRDPYHVPTRNPLGQYKFTIGFSGGN